MTTDIKQLRGTERLIRLDCLFDGKAGCACSHCEASDTIARLAAERDRLAGEVEAYESARVTWAESMRAWINRATVAERESDRLKAALKLWQDAWATGRNEPMAIAANVTRYELGGDA